MIDEIKMMVSYYYHTGLNIGRNLMNDQHGALSVRGILEMVLGLIVVSVLLPIGIKEFMASDLANGSGAVGTIWRITPVIIVVGVIIGLIGNAVSGA